MQLNLSKRDTLENLTDNILERLGQAMHDAGHWSFGPDEDGDYAPRVRDYLQAHMNDGKELSWNAQDNSIGEWEDDLAPPDFVGGEGLFGFVFGILSERRRQSDLREAGLSDLELELESTHRDSENPTEYYMPPRNPLEALLAQLSAINDYDPSDDDEDPFYLFGEDDIA